MTLYFGFSEDAGWTKKGLNLDKSFINILKNLMKDERQANCSEKKVRKLKIKKNLDMSGDDWLENCLSFLIIFLLMILYTFCWVGGYSLAYLGRISDPWHKIDPIPNQSELLRVNWVSNSSGSVLQGCGLSHSYGVILKNKNVSTTWCSDGIDAWEKFLRTALKSQNKKLSF